MFSLITISTSSLYAQEEETLEAKVAVLEG